MADMVYEEEEDTVYGMAQPRETMTIEDGQFRRSQEPGNMEVEAMMTGTGMPVGVGGTTPPPGGMGGPGGPESDANMDAILDQAGQTGAGSLTDEQIMQVMNKIPAGGQGGQGGGGMARPNAAYENEIATPEGQTRILAGDLESGEQPEEIARQLLARRAAARKEISSSFQKQAEQINAAPPTQQYVG